MKKYLLMMLVVLTGIVSSCKYDDDELWDNVDDLANRVSAIEALTNQMNGDIAAMQAIVTAVENQVAVSNVEKLTDGYILHFTNGTTATIKNGEDGKDGANGADGEDGKDGANGTDGADGKDGKDAPAMGIAQENGVYYWTLTVDGETDWLTDDAGNKIPVTGADGADGDDGYSGSTGSSAKTPTLSVDKDGYWMVSYGGTYEYILDGNQKISALGTTGSNGVTRFKTPVVNEEKGTITIEMVNGDSFVLPLLKSLVFKDKDGKVVDIKNISWSGANQTFEYTFELQLEGAKYQKVDEAGVEAGVDFADRKVTLTLKSNAVSDARVVLLFFNETTTLTSVFRFVVAPWDGENSVAVTPTENETVYEIATPANLKWIAEQVNNGTSFEGKTIKLLNNIDLGGKAWTPIGEDSSKPFSGTFDGNGKTITGLQVGTSVFKSKALSRNTSTETTGATVKGAGLFGVVKGATLKGVTIKDAVVNPSENVDGAGILVGCALESVTFEGVTIAQETVTENNETTNVVQGSQNVGTVAGLVSASQVTVKDCEVQSASVTATTETSSSESTSAGGVIGMLEVKADASETPKVEISGCKVDGVDLSAAGTEDTSSSAGGVVGSLKVDGEVSENVSDIIKVENNSVAETQVKNETTEEQGSENSTQGTVIGNLSELDATVAGNIINNNTVSEDTQIENQLTVANLQTILDMVVTSANVNTFDVKGSGMGDVKSISVPAVGANVTLNFASLVTTADKSLTITDGDGTIGDKLTINMSVAEQYLNIQTCQSTVTLASGVYAKVSSMTAKDTLIVKEEVNIATLEVSNGAVQVFGTVENLVRSEGVDEVITVMIEDGGEIVNVPDEGFNIVYRESVVIKNPELSAILLEVLGSDKVSIDAQGFAVMKRTDVENVKTLNFGILVGNNKYLPSLAGIEHFKNLESFHFRNEGSSLKSIDFSKNLNLKNLELVFANPDVLDLSKNVNLEKLLLVHMHLDHLDLSKNVKLKSLNVNECHLTSLNISELPLLEELYCDNQLNEDFSQGIDLIVTMTPAQMALWDSKWKNNNKNRVTPVLAGSVVIENVKFSDALLNYLGKDKVSINEDGYAVIDNAIASTVKVLDFGGREYIVNTFDGIENFPNLTYFACSPESNLTSCDLSKNTKLTHVQLEMNLSLTSLNISGLNNLEFLSVVNTGLSGTLDLSEFSKLKTLHIGGSRYSFKNIIFPDVNLVDLDVSGKNFTVENITALLNKYKSSLKKFNCHNNSLKSLDVSMVPALEELKCFDNPFTSVLDLTNNTKLTYLECGSSSEEAIDYVTVKLTDAQKTLWNSTWKNYWANKGVNIYENEIGSGTGLDFGIVEF